MTNRRFTVLILGATGVFGSRLAERLAGEPGIALILAARTASKLEQLRDRTCPAAAIRLVDRERIGAADLVGADVVVDAAGPFQGSRSAVIDAALAAGVDYVDLADGREFVAAIGRFGDRARQAGIA
ncbi:MAG: saccharopine dehydrogenase NADP-binding domain-containing protein, partial [Novosphingobium sp.]